MATRELKSLGQLFKESSQAVRRNFAIFIFLNTATILGTAWNVGLDLRDKSRGSDWGQVLLHTVNGGGDYPDTNVWLAALLTLLTVVLGLLLLFLTYLAARKKVVNFAEVWESCKEKWWKVIITFLLVAVCVIAGLFLLILPGLYLIARLALAPIVTIDEDLVGSDALRRSWELTKGHAWIVFTTVFFGLVLSLPSIIPVVGRLIATALVIAYSVALPIRYFELKHLRSSNV